MIMRLYIIAASMLAAFAANAQTQLHDEQKERQILSMENFHWTFAPDWYYSFAHSGYSGSYHRGFNTRFSEARSNTKRCFIERSANAMIYEEAKKENRIQNDTINQVCTQELLDAADRKVDLAFLEYQSDFKDMKNKISAALAYIAVQSRGNMAMEVADLTDELKWIDQQITYIHSMGLDEELENTKRMVAYEEISADMRDLLVRCNKMAYYTRSKYPNLL